MLRAGMAYFLFAVAAEPSTLWNRIQTTVIKKRDGFVHCRDEVTDGVAELALQCVRSPHYLRNSGSVSAGLSSCRLTA